MHKVATCVALLLCGASNAATAVSLVVAGKPSAAIVISREAAPAKPWLPAPRKAATASAKVKLAAEELQKYVEKVTGARLPILADDAAIDPTLHLVIVGNNARSADLVVPSGLTPARKEEGFVVVATENRLVLAGNDEGPYQGTFFAVADFLERIGVRWFMPGAFGEHVPHLEDLSIAPMSFRGTPDFIVRSWNGNLAPELRAGDAIWRLRNRMTLDADAIIALPIDGTLSRYMPDKALAATNPEYFARNADGSPNVKMVSLTHPDVPKLVAEKIKARIRTERLKNPSFNSLGFSPPDGLPVDHSPEAAASSLGFADLTGRDGDVSERSISEEWFHFAHAVTREVVAEFPEFVLVTNGYANRTAPPEGLAIHPNLGVMFAAIWADMLHRLDDRGSWQQVVQAQMLRRWAEMSQRVFVYGYNSPMLVNALTPVPATRRIAANVPLLKHWGIIGFQDEQTFSWMAHGIQSFYLRARMYWNARLDSRAVLQDYYSKWYGPAEASSSGFWDAIEESLENTRLQGHEDRVLPFVYSDGLLARLEEHQKASESVATSEPYATRVRVDRLILEHLKGYMEMSRAELSGDFGAATRAANRMFEQREQLAAISPYFVYPESRDPRKRYFSGSHYWNLTQRRDYFSVLHELLDGNVVAKVSEARMRVDPNDLGRFGRWHDPGHDRSSWTPVVTSTPFYLQGKDLLSESGIPYVGYLWYAFEVDLPEFPAGKPVHAYLPTVVTEAWMWVNGEYGGHRPYKQAYIRPAPMEVDVAKFLKPGQNVIAVRVNTSNNLASAAEGILGPLILHTPGGAAPVSRP